MASGSLDVHEAFVAALKTALAAAPVSGRVYDRVPDAATFPYVQVTPLTMLPYDGINLRGSEVIIRVDVWSRLAGTMAEAHAVAASLYAALHDAVLTLDAETFVNCRAVDQIMRRVDGTTVQSLTTFRVVTHS